MALRVALVTHAFSWEGAGGGELMLRLLAERLAAQGHDVHVVTSDQEATMAGGAFRVHKASSGTTLALRRVLKELRPDVVDAHNMETSIQAILAARSLRIPVVVTVNSAWPVCLFADIYRPGHGICDTCSVHGVAQCFERRPPENIGRRVPAVVGYAEVRRRRALLALADRLIAHSEASRNVLERNGLPASRIRVVPNMDDGTFHATPAHEGERILYAGGLTFPKGADVALDAFALLARERPTAVLDIAGGGYLRPELEARAARAGIEGRVTFLGYLPRSELRERYRRASVVLFPSRAEETFGRIVLEAWGTGAPIVATRVSAPGELVKDGVTGLLVDPEDPKDVAAALLRVLREPDLAARLAANGLAELPRFAPDVITHRFVDVYEEARR